VKGKEVSRYRKNMGDNISIIFDMSTAQTGLQQRNQKE
jgi:hypothetical protein